MSIESRNTGANNKTPLGPDHTPSADDFPDTMTYTEQERAQAREAHRRLQHESSSTDRESALGAYRRRGREFWGGKGGKNTLKIAAGIGAFSTAVTAAGVMWFTNSLERAANIPNRGEPVDPVRPPIAEAPVVPGPTQEDEQQNEQLTPTESTPSVQEQELVAPMGTEFSRTVTARGIPIPEHIQEVRNQALELCTRGNGGRQMAADWTDYGFENSVGMDWPTAFTFMADRSWMGGTSAYAIAEDVYRNINDLAENCQEAAFIASSGLDSYFHNYVIADVRKELEKFRELPYNPTTTIMTSFQQSINDSYDKGYIERPN